jgi:DNA replicative helicase MCM subunit Mcm2 (Cdc46/Mcm family)
MVAEFPIIQFPREVPNAWEMEQRRWRPRDITEDIMGRILPPLPKHMIELIHVCMVGTPGTGKTEAVKYLAMRACLQYGPNNVHIICTDDLNVAIAELDERPVQFLFVDDAAKFNNSRQAGKKENVEKTGDFQLLRHLQRQASGRRNGLVICIFAWQRYMDLIPALRAGYITIFKSGQPGRYDYAETENMLGPYTQIITEIWDKGKRGDRDAKNWSVAHIASLKGTGRENGLFRTEMIDFPEFPEVIRSEDYYREEAEPEVEIGPELEGRLDELRDTLGPHVVRCYEEVEINGLSIREAAEKLGLSRSTLHRYVSRVQDELDGEAKWDGGTAPQNKRARA